jgi:hypothetical protein
MIYTNLYEETLVKPCEEGANILKIISGYATPAMASDHLDDLYSRNLNINIKLLLGMCPIEGLKMSYHQGFQDLVKSNTISFKNRFNCSYIYKVPPVHSKLYIWYKNDDFYKAFIGSANYTKNAFSNRQREVLAEINDTNILQYYDIIEKESIYCELQEVEELICIHKGNYYRKHIQEDKTVDTDTKNTDVEHIKVSLLSSRTGEVQNRGGLNWGQREGREPNQAYIQLPPDVYNGTFFPKAPQHFMVVTDDSKTIVCRRAEKDEQGQTIHSTLNNSHLGEYFRNRLGLASGAFVEKKHLEQYGRTDVTFYKFSDEEYYMDFSV